MAHTAIVWLHGLLTPSPSAVLHEAMLSSSGRLTPPLPELVWGGKQPCCTFREKSAKLGCGLHTVCSGNGAFRQTEQVFSEEMLEPSKPCRPFSGDSGENTCMFRCPGCV